MNIYILTQNQVGGQGIIDRAVVVADSIHAAQRVHPCSDHGADWDRWETCHELGLWCDCPENVYVEKIGLADEKKERVICFHKTHENTPYDNL